MEEKEQSEKVTENTEQNSADKTSSKKEEKAVKKAQARERRLKRRVRRNARIARGRWLKNLFIWFMGVLFLPTAIIVGALVVPVSTITGKDGQIVSEELSKKTVFDAVKFVIGNASELGFSDFPILTRTLSDLQTKQIGEKEDGEGHKVPLTVGDIVYIDTAKLGGIKFGSSNLAGDVQGCVEVVATIESLGGASALGDIGGLSVFTEEEKATYFKKSYVVSDVGAAGGLDNTADNFEPKAYYYKTKEVDDAAADNVYKRAFNEDKSLVDVLSALTEEQKAQVGVYVKAACTVADVGVLKGLDNTADDFEPKEYYYKTKEIDDAAADNVYKRAFNDDKSLVEELSALTEEQKAQVYIYYPPLEKVKLSELKDIFGDSIGRTTISSLLDVMGGTNQTLTDIVGEDTTIKGLKDFDINEQELYKVLPVPDAEHPERNKKLYDILRDATGVAGATVDEQNKKIKIGDLSGIDTDNIKLATVLTAPTEENEYKNQKIYDILRDATGISVNEQIQVGNLASFTADNIHLNTVMGDVSDNQVLTALKNKNITVGEIGSALNDLSLYEVYGVNSFLVYDSTKTTLDVERSFYKVYNYGGDIAYMLDYNGILSAAPNTYYYGYGYDTVLLKFVRSYVDTIVCGAVDQSVEYYKCKNKTTFAESFEYVSPEPDTETYEYNTKTKYYKTANDYYVTTDYATFYGLPQTEYLCFTSTGEMGYKTVAELGATDMTEYYKCKNKTTEEISFQLVSSDPNPDIYDFDDNKTYYHTTNGYYVRSNYSEPIYVDTRDVMFKVGTDNYCVCEGSDVETGYFTLTDATAAGYVYDSTVKYYLCYEGTEERGYFTAAEAAAAGYTYDSTVEYFRCYQKHFWTAAEAAAAGYAYDDSVIYKQAHDYVGETFYFVEEKYYLDKNSGLWLLLSFDTAEYEGDTATRRFSDQNGKAYKYSIDILKIGDLQTGSIFAKKFKNATIQQLVDSGMINDPEFTRTESYKYSLQELLDILKDVGL